MDTSSDLPPPLAESTEIIPPTENAKIQVTSSSVQNATADMKAKYRKRMPPSTSFRRPFGTSKVDYEDHFSEKTHSDPSRYSHSGPEGGTNKGFRNDFPKSDFSISVRWCGFNSDGVERWFVILNNSKIISDTDVENYNYWIKKYSTSN
jgi:hypothetical protein